MTKLYDWSEVKAEYVERCLKPEKTPFSYFTNKYGMKYHTFMGKRKTQQWDKEVKKQREKLSVQTLKKVRTRLSTSDAEDILDEISVRKKNMELANIVLETLIEEWAAKISDPKQRKLLTLPTIMSGIAMVSGLRGKAAGLPEKLDINSKNLSVNIGVDTDHLSPAENRKMVRDAEDLANGLQTLLKEFEAIDVKPTNAKKSKVQKVLKGKGNNKS